MYIFWCACDCQAFSQDSPKTFKNFCLAHLFTYTSFSNGVLGLAYIGGAQMYSVGGICSSREFIAEILSYAMQCNAIRIQIKCIEHHKT